MLELFKGADEVDDAGDAKVLGCSGAGFDGDGAERGGAALGEDDAVDAGAIGDAKKSAEILRVFDAIEREDEASGGGMWSRDRASKRSSMVRNSCGRTSATTPWWAGVLAARVSCSRDSSRTRTPAWRHWATRRSGDGRRGARGRRARGQSGGCRP